MKLQPFYYDPGIPGALPGKGFLDPDYCIVGIAPSVRRPPERILEPFGSRSYKVLDRLQRQFGQENFYMTNVCKEPHPSGKKLGVRMLRKWSPFLMEELKLVRPRRILAVGREPAELLCGPGFSGLMDDHGAFFHNKELDAHVIPTFHFSAVARNPKLDALQKRDFQRFFMLDEPEPLPEPTVIYSLDDLPTLDGYVTLDIETTGLSVMDNIFHIGIEHNDQYFILAELEEGVGIDPLVIHYLGKKMYDDGSIFIGQNLAFDTFQLVAHDAHPDESYWPWLPVQDTMLLVHNSGQSPVTLRLKHLTTMYTDLPGPHAVAGEEGVASLSYLTHDLISTKRVHQIFSSEYKTFSGRLMSDCAQAFGAMRARGVYIDRNQLQLIREPLVERLTALEEQLRDVAQINWGSPQQVAKAMLDNGVPLTEMTDAGNYSVSESVLVALRDDYELADKLLDYRALAKLLSGFVDSYLNMDSSYIYPSFLLHGTETGRLSCKGPNLQQLPRQGPVKLIFRSRWEGGRYALVDLDGAELRMTAMITNDTRLADVLLESDIHRETAATAFGIPVTEVTSTQRKSAKPVVFSTLYGSSVRGIAKKQNMDEDLARQIQQGFFAAFPITAKWMKSARRKIEHTDVVHTPYGRTRDLAFQKLIEGHNGAWRKYINTGPQSAASDTMLTVFRHVYHQLLERGLRSRPLMTIHDSTIFEVYPGEEDAFAHVVQDAFINLNNGPMAQYPLWQKLPLTGELIMSYPNGTWANVESTSYYYRKERTWTCSSHGIQTELVDQTTQRANRSLADDAYIKYMARNGQLEPWLKEIDDAR